MTAERVQPLPDDGGAVPAFLAAVLEPIHWHERRSEPEEEVEEGYLEAYEATWREYRAEIPIWHDEDPVVVVRMTGEHVAGVEKREEVACFARDWMGHTGEEARWCEDAMRIDVLYRAAGLERPQVAGRCRRCGCTDLLGCAEGCAWADAERTLCTSCRRPKPRPKPGGGSE